MSQIRDRCHPMLKICTMFDLLFSVYTPDCPHPCVVNGHHFCYPPPCPPPACDDPVYAPGQCCTVCPDDCPRGACTIGNRTMCYPIPCPLPPCKNPVSTPGECCPHCPQGRDVIFKFSLNCLKIFFFVHICTS